ncbi:MAG: radical SAM protein, partial [Treponema sp.]|nr:radical SAM protein [Treponema sp.]
SFYRSCVLCPRNCGADRAGGRRGFCGETSELRIASAVIHHGEEPPVSGRGGSGAVFVTGCNVGCAFCQNGQISGAGRNTAKGGMGRVVETEEFVRICLALESRGAENINLVTGSHAVPALAAGLDAARNAGLAVPVLWNTSSYENPAVLEILKDRVDMYLPDLKTLDRDTAAEFLNAPDYGVHAAAAILKMMEYRPLKVIIRHLILPGYLESTRGVLRWFAAHARGRALLSLMTQFTPVPWGSFAGRTVPDRSLNREEYDTALRWLEEFDIEEGFFQGLEAERDRDSVQAAGPGLSVKPDALPDFTEINPFGVPGGEPPLAEPVWHWREGFCGIGQGYKKEP